MFLCRKELRNQILNAMEVEASIQEGKVTEGETIVRVSFGRFFGGLAMAATLAMGVYLAINVGEVNSLSDRQPDGLADLGELNSYKVQREMGVVLQASTDSLDFDYKPLPGESLEDVCDWIHCSHSPSLTSVPRGLEEAKIIGIKKVALTTGHPASLVTFYKEGIGDLHMIVMDAETVADLGRFEVLDKVGVKKCDSCPITQFVIARWRDSDNAYMLMSKAEPKKIQEIF